MLRIIYIAIFAIFMSASSFAFEPDFDVGKAAYTRDDYKTALSHFRSLSEQGYSNAQYNLGVMYDNGEGVAEDNREAVRWYLRAAEHGLSSAQYNLGVMYFSGEGVAEDNREAVRWTRLAAEQGYSGAQINLGVMYEYGLGVTQDFGEAYVWYSIAAASGFEEEPNYLVSTAGKMTAQALEKAQQRASELYEKIH